MNGQIERDQNVYPIGAILNGNCTTNGPTYDIVDMRDLEVLYNTQCTYKELEPTLATLNANLRNGKYEEDYNTIKDDALLLLLGVQMEPECPTHDVPELTPTEQVSVALATLPALPKL